MNITLNIGAQPSSYSRRDILNSDAMDFLGRPVFSDLWLKEGDTKLLFVNAILTITRDFTITKTAMQGRSGTVKEYIGAGDYQVNVQASLLETSSEKYPVSDLQKLIAIMNSQKQIEVISELLSLFGIYYVVPEKFQLTQALSGQNRQGVVLEFISDKDIQLVIEEESSLAPTTPNEATFND